MRAACTPEARAAREVAGGSRDTGSGASQNATVEFRGCSADTVQTTIRCSAEALASLFSGNVATRRFEAWMDWGATRWAGPVRPADRGMVCDDRVTGAMAAEISGGSLEVVGTNST